MTGRRHIVGVIGAGAASEPLRRAAEAVGRLLVDEGFRIVSGGRGGVMEAASAGARSSPAYREGDVLGILPSLHPSDANPSVDIVIPTGLGLARNVLVVATADALIAVGGGSGTLAEIAIGWQLDKPIVGLDLGEGWSSELAGRSLDERRSDTIVRAESPQAAVDAVVAALS